ncbi:hypothetical protein GLAREA_03433 [Glarea lozoyensis ATCC 20868]|uniref:Uncharacterized protein n=1 Tax=Glarea lozoyensis (strain ATCC 20868 / MF5171) TaxID=1116229 RepID=S3DER2_GLAL2|nr:uncharacterized protein GLAREA_03433 [Glarea lozoyensis ATCC 20868]EPE30466.1 hypothetical protein GLAREA_03433 [Glarea lozoyensis ATCC 20868]
MSIADGWEQKKRCDIGLSIHKQGNTLFAQGRTPRARQRAPGMVQKNTPSTRSLSSRPEANGHDGANMARNHTGMDIDVSLASVMAHITAPEGRWLIRNTPSKAKDAGDEKETNREL